MVAFINTLVVKTCDITREYSYASSATQAKNKIKKLLKVEVLQNTITEMIQSEQLRECR